ncbi:MAG TPA: RNA polymerase sigma-70 factor [Chitinophagaceae bacterium]|nr:RNA polymerase sigma-70 factor [Chitinophagaceae bacterium]MBP7313735.1 RNA polymerase sigma-70 factor [Chitinophagaceae bacterium]HQV54444.1 RNA polymerase sigma-70 factor [Chitinophagaceae bacterium]HQZ78643.1 RNA polymerase sigma-70 factor [Bacteroidia bacterium]
MIKTLISIVHSYNSYDEIELLSQLKKGSEGAFEELYNLYSTRLFGNLLKLVKSETEAKEILQDVFIKIWDNRQHIDTEKSFRSYLFKIAENKVYDLFRKISRDKKRKEALLSIATSEYVHIEETILNKESTALLNKAIESLPPQRQQIFRLCKLEGKSYKEVSELLGISTSTISDHIVKATKSIRSYFEDSEHTLLKLIVISFLAGT